MNRGKARGYNNKKGQLAHIRDDTTLREIKTEDLNKYAKTLVDLIEQRLTVTDVSNATFYKVLSFIHTPKPKGDDKNQKMRLLVVSHINCILDKVDDMVKRYPNIRRKILHRRAILEEIDLLCIIDNLIANKDIIKM